MQKYVTLEKTVGQTPLECAEIWRATQPDMTGVPLAYAGRLDPMASGKLLVLIGEECKKQTDYHSLDKEYVFEVLFGVQSDTADVLGLIEVQNPITVTKSDLVAVAATMTGEIELPYPHFSSKTVQGKPLHTWKLEGRIHEIEIPTKKSTIHKLEVLEAKAVPGTEVHRYATEKIETIPPVTDTRKALGNDFRRPDVRLSWADFSKNHANQTFTVAKFRCIASSGTYMRTLAEVLADRLTTTGLAYLIHRTKIGIYQPLPIIGGVWRKQYK